MAGPPQIVIIGGGLGGLCAAHGLRAAGFGVTVHERDPSAGHRSQGYRLHLDSRGAGALHECLPARSYELFVATAGRPSTRVTIVDERLRELHAVEVGSGSLDGDPATFSAAVDRRTLREVLLAGLGALPGAALHNLVGDYERAMTKYGFAAVRAAERHG